MSTKLTLIVTLALAACGAKTSAPRPVPTAADTIASSCEPPPPPPPRPTLAELGVGSCAE